ncbi:MAG: adenosylcobinamide amidohydrolase [Halobacteriota archaeon]
MEYEILDRVLVVKGNFEALSSGVDGGRRAVKNILNIQVSPDFSHDDPKSYIEGITASLTLKGDRLALLTAVEMKNVRILSDACVTVFVTAGLTNPSSFGTINIIVISSETLSEGAIVGTIITTTEAKTRALIDKGLQFTGTTSDAIIVAYENSGEGEPILYSGLATSFGSRVAKLVRLGVKEALKAHYGSDDVDKWKLSLGH